MGRLHATYAQLKHMVGAVDMLIGFSSAVQRLAFHVADVPQQFPFRFSQTHEGSCSACLKGGHTRGRQTSACSCGTRTNTATSGALQQVTCRRKPQRVFYNVFTSSRQGVPYTNSNQTLVL